MLVLLQTTHLINIFELKLFDFAPHYPIYFQIQVTLTF